MLILTNFTKKIILINVCSPLSGVKFVFLVIFSVCIHDSVCCVNVAEVQLLLMSDMEASLSLAGSRHHNSV